MTETVIVNASTRQSSVTMDSGLADAGKPGGVHGEQRADARHAQRHAKYAAGQREQDAFGQQLADDAAAPRADRRTNGNFTLAARRAGQQQVGDVGACNQQHQRNRAQQDPERGADVGDEFILQQPRAKRAVVVQWRSDTAAWYSAAESFSRALA